MTSVSIVTGGRFILAPTKCEALSKSPHVKSTA
jgi:hypothetical protein